MAQSARLRAIAAQGNLGDRQNKPASLQAKYSISLIRKVFKRRGALSVNAKVHRVFVQVFAMNLWNHVLSPVQNFSIGKAPSNLTLKKALHSLHRVIIIDILCAAKLISLDTAFVFVHV